MPESATPSPTPARPRRIDLARRGAGWKPVLLSLALGVLIWGYIDSRRMEQRLFEIRLAWEIPEGWQIVPTKGKLPPETISIQARGPRQIMAAIQTEEVRLVPRIEVSGQENYSHTVSLHAQDIRGLPREVSVMAVQPQHWPLSLVRLVTEYVRINVSTTGEPDPGHVLGVKQADPWFVAVKVPHGLIDPQRDVMLTEPVDVTGAESMIVETVRLQPLVKTGHPPIIATTPIYIRINVEEKMMRRTFEKVPVRLLKAPHESFTDVTLQPAAVKVTVEGYANRLTALSATEITVYIDSRDIVAEKTGEYVLRCKGLTPDWVNVVSMEPAEIKWMVPVANRKGRP